jgi:hypothetical protein
VDIEGAALVILLGDENTIFFEEEDSMSLEIGDPCPKVNHESKCNTTFPVTCLLFDQPDDETVYACNGTVIGRLFLDFVPEPPVVLANGTDNLI